MNFRIKHIRDISLLLLFSLWTSILQPVYADAEDPPLKKLKSQADYVVQLWDNTKGLPQNAIYAMEMDNTGFLWMATEEGLARFDGSLIKVFDKDTYPVMLDQTYYAFFKGKSGIWASSDRSIALLEKNIHKVIDCNHIAEDSWIMTLSEDSNGYLWIGTQDGNIHLWKNDQFSQLPNWKTEPGLEVVSLFHKGDGSMLIGTNKGLFHYNYSNKTYQLLTERDTNVRRVMMDNGMTYIGIPEKGIFRVEDNKVLTQLVSFDRIRDFNFPSITKDQFNNVWSGSTEDGIIRISAEGIERYYFKEVKNYLVRKILFDGENLYLGTHGRGLVVVKPAKVRTVPFPQLIDKNIKAIFQDSDQNQWIGTKSEGLYKIKKGNITNISAKDGLLLNWINSIGEDKNHIYAGTTAGVSIIDKSSNKIIGQITESDGLRSNYVYAIFWDADETLWILTRYGGIHYREQGGKIVTLELPASFRNANFTSIHQLKNGELIAGTRNAGFFRIKDRKIREQVRLPLKPGEDVIYAVYEDNDGDLWFGTHGGIVVYTKGNFKRITKEKGLNAVSVFSITHDGYTGVWISNNFGVQYFPDAELRRFKQSDDPDFFINSVTYNNSHGMPNSETNGLIFPSAFKDGENKIWIPTVEGVGIIDPLNIDWEENSANFQWDELLVADQKNPIIGSELIIPAGNNNFQVSFSNIDFSNPAQFSLTYRISPASGNWLQVKDNRYLTFNGLNPGKHLLEFRIYRNGKLDSTHKLDILVKGFFFESLWFKILVLILVCILIIFIVNYTAKVKVNSKLEQLVTLRTTELSTTNERLTKALEEIESQNSALKDITWQQSHLVRAPLTKALGLIQLLINYPKYQDVGKSKEELEKEVLKTLEDLDALVRQTHKKSEHFAKK